MGYSTATVATAENRVVISQILEECSSSRILLVDSVVGRFVRGWNVRVGGSDGEVVRREENSVLDPSFFSDARDNVSVASIIVTRKQLFSIP